MSEGTVGDVTAERSRVLFDEHGRSTRILGWVGLIGGIVAVLWIVVASGNSLFEWCFGLIVLACWIVFLIYAPQLSAHLPIEHVVRQGDTLTLRPRHWLAKQKSFAVRLDQVEQWRWDGDNELTWSALSLVLPGRQFFSVDQRIYLYVQGVPLSLKLQRGTQVDFDELATFIPHVVTPLLQRYPRLRTNPKPDTA